MVLIRHSLYHKLFIPCYSNRMNEINEQGFIKGTERLVKPADVSAISFFNGYTRLLPKSIQQFLIAKTAKKIPHMGFVVEPYSLFLCYKLADPEWAERLMLPDYRLIKTSIFQDDEPSYYVIFGCVTAHTSAFWGSRIEMYVIAEHKRTGLLTWVIIDYDTNTNSNDPKRGLTVANSTNSVMTTTHHGNVLVDMRRDDGSHRLTVAADSTAGKMTPLDQRLWLEGNLSIDYGTNLTDQAKPFALTFDPREVEQALRVPPQQVVIEANTWYPGLFESQPSQVVCFPYAQHFVTGSNQTETTVRNRAELIAAANALGDLSQFKGFSAKPLKRQLVLGALMSSLVSTSLILYIVWHFLSAH